MLWGSPRACSTSPIGTEAARALPAGLVYAGFSLGALPAQALAQRRPVARGALLFHGGVPSELFGSGWPSGLPLEIHTMDDDPYAERDEVQPLLDAVPDATLHRYPGTGHLFAEPSWHEYDEAAADLLLERTVAFLDRVG